MNLSSLLIFSALFHSATSFSSLVPKNKKTSIGDINRQDFITLIVSGSVSSTLLLPREPAFARGRATLEYSLDRYYPRIEAGGVFYANDLKKAIEKNDWNAIKVSLLHLVMHLYE